MTEQNWKPGDKAVATVRGKADVEVIRTDDAEFPWHSDERIPDYFGPQTEHPERHVKHAAVADRSVPSREGLAPMSANADAGLESRYRVEKVNDPTGKHDDCRYFVLDPQHDPVARAALRAYADAPGTSDDLRADLMSWLDDIGAVRDDEGHL